MSPWLFDANKKSPKSTRSHHKVERKQFYQINFLLWFKCFCSGTWLILSSSIKSTICLRERYFQWKSQLYDSSNSQNIGLYIECGLQCLICPSRISMHCYIAYRTRNKWCDKGLWSSLVKSATGDSRFLLCKLIPSTSTHGYYLEEILLATIVCYRKIDNWTYAVAATIGPSPYPYEQIKLQIGLFDWGARINCVRVICSLLIKYLFTICSYHGGTILRAKDKFCAVLDTTQTLDRVRVDVFFQPSIVPVLHIYWMECKKANIHALPGEAHYLMFW